MALLFQLLLLLLLLGLWPGLLITRGKGEEGLIS